MLNLFSYVIQGDCTYKTNFYRLALLQVASFTCTGKNFTIAYAFLENEKEDNYLSALNQLHNLFQANSLPIVIYADRDYDFMNAVEKVFPESKHHLCRRHIEVNYAISTLNVAAWMNRCQEIEDEYGISYP
ncbi:hypothetical protein LIER_42754 [Lithospermum erythrorhizon]